MRSYSRGDGNNKRKKVFGVNDIGRIVAGIAKETIGDIVILNGEKIVKKDREILRHIVKKGTAAYGNTIKTIYFLPSTIYKEFEGCDDIETKVTELGYAMIDFTDNVTKKVSKKGRLSNDGEKIYFIYKNGHHLVS